MKALTCESFKILCRNIITHNPTCKEKRGWLSFGPDQHFKTFSFSNSEHLIWTGTHTHTGLFHLWLTRLVLFGQPVLHKNNSSHFHRLAWCQEATCFMWSTVPAVGRGSRLHLISVYSAGPQLSKHHKRRDYFCLWLLCVGMLYRAFEDLIFVQFLWNTWKCGHLWLNTSLLYSLIFLKCHSFIIYYVLLCFQLRLFFYSPQLNN